MRVKATVAILAGGVPAGMKRFGLDTASGVRFGKCFAISGIRARYDRKSAVHAGRVISTFYVICASYKGSIREIGC